MGFSGDALARTAAAPGAPHLLEAQHRPRRGRHAGRGLRPHSSGARARAHGPDDGRRTRSGLRHRVGDIGGTGGQEVRGEPGARASRAVGGLRRIAGRPLSRQCLRLRARATQIVDGALQERSSPRHHRRRHGRCAGGLEQSVPSCRVQKPSGSVGATLDGLPLWRCCMCELALSACAAARSIRLTRHRTHICSFSLMSNSVGGALSHGFTLPMLLASETRGPGVHRAVADWALCCAERKERERGRGLVLVGRLVFSLRARTKEQVKGGLGAGWWHGVVARAQCDGALTRLSAPAPVQGQ